MEGFKAPPPPGNTHKTPIIVQKCLQIPPPPLPHLPESVGFPRVELVFPLLPFLYPLWQEKRKNPAHQLISLQKAGKGQDQQHITSCVQKEEVFKDSGTSPPLFCLEKKNLNLPPSVSLWWILLLLLYIYVLLLYKTSAPDKLQFFSCVLHSFFWCFFFPDKEIRKHDFFFATTTAAAALTFYYCYSMYLTRVYKERQQNKT